MHTIVELLGHNCGISFLYRSAVEKELAKGLLQLILLEDFTLSHDFHFIWNRHAFMKKTI